MRALSLRESSVYPSARIRFCARAKEIRARAGRFALAHYINLLSRYQNALSTFGSKITPYLPLFRCQSRSRQECLLSDWGVLLLDVIMSIAVVIYSRHLSGWRRSGLLLFLKGMSRSPIYLNVFMFAWIIRDPASTTEVSIRFFLMNLCKSPFLIMCQLASSTAKFHSLVRTACHPMEGRGGVSRAH